MSKVLRNIFLEEMRNMESSQYPSYYLDIAYSNEDSYILAFERSLIRYCKIVFEQWKNILVPSVSINSTSPITSGGEFDEAFSIDFNIYTFISIGASSSGSFFEYLKTEILETESTLFRLNGSREDVLPDTVYDENSHTTKEIKVSNRLGVFLYNAFKDKSDTKYIEKLFSALGKWFNDYFVIKILHTNEGITYFGNGGIVFPAFASIGEKVQKSLETLKPQSSFEFYSLISYYIQFCMENNFTTPIATKRIDSEITSLMITVAESFYINDDYSMNIEDGTLTFQPIEKQEPFNIPEVPKYPEFDIPDIRFALSTVDTTFLASTLKFNSWKELFLDLLDKNPLVYPFTLYGKKYFSKEMFESNIDNLNQPTLDEIIISLNIISKNHLFTKVYDVWGEYKKSINEENPQFPPFTRLIWDDINLDFSVDNIADSIGGVNKLFMYTATFFNLFTPEELEELRLAVTESDTLISLNDTLKLNIPDFEDHGSNIFDVSKNESVVSIINEESIESATNESEHVSCNVGDENSIISIQPLEININIRSAGSSVEEPIINVSFVR